MLSDLSIKKRYSVTQVNFFLNNNESLTKKFMMIHKMMAEKKIIRITTFYFYVTTLYYYNLYTNTVLDGCVTLCVCVSVRSL